jgi:hypothetical protein
MKGRQKHADRLKILSGQGRLIKAVGRVLYVGADMIRAEAHRSISAGSVSGKKHKPSAQNTPPNRDTGVLQAHLRAELVSPLKALVTSEAPYAAALENGSSRKAGTTGRGSFPTRKDGSSKFGPIKREFGDSKTAARPYMRPARDKKAPEIQRLFETEIDKLVKGSGS